MFRQSSLPISVLACLLAVAPCIGAQGAHGTNVANPFRPAVGLAQADVPTTADHAASQPDKPLEFDPGDWDSTVPDGMDFTAPCCATPSCSCREPCCVEPCAFWAEADHLLWWTKGMRVPALVTTCPDGTASDEAGVLGATGTSILFGDSEMNDGPRSGGRFELGTWLNPSHCNAIEVTYMFLDEEQESFRGTQTDYTILARPFFNVEDGQQDSSLINYHDVGDDLDDLVEGSLDVSVKTKFDSLSVAYRATTIRSPYGSFGVYGGYRFARLNDDINISSSTVSLDPATLGTTYDLYDAFSADNTFNGGEFAVDFQQQIGDRWWGQMSAKAALGATRSRTRISGQTTTIDGTSTTVTDGGLLTQPTNLGGYGSTNVSSIMEFGVSLRRKLSPCTALVFGYDCVFWTKVLRAGDQIDFAVNPTQISGGTLDGPARPSFPNAASTYWAQGLRFGFEAQF